MGRWVNRDPIQERGGINVYLAAGNNLINSFDPLGLKTWGFWESINYLNNEALAPQQPGYVAPPPQEPKFPNFSIVGTIISAISPQGVDIDKTIGTRIAPLGTGWIFASIGIKGSLFVCSCGKSDDNKIENLQVWFAGSVTGEVYWQIGYSIAVYEGKQLKTVEILKSGGDKKRRFSSASFSHQLGNIKQCPIPNWSVTLSAKASIEASAGVGWKGTISGGYNWTRTSIDSGWIGQWVGTINGEVTYGNWGSEAKLGGEVSGKLETKIGVIE